MTGPVFAMIWPVLDPSRTFRQLQREAEPLLHDELVDRNLTATGAPAWETLEVPGLSGAAADGLALGVRLPVRPIEQPQSGEAPTGAAERRAARLEQVADLTARGLSAQQIGDRLGVRPRQVVRDRAALAEPAAEQEAS